MSEAQQLIAWAIPILVLVFTGGAIIGYDGGRRAERDAQEWARQRGGG